MRDWDDFDEFTAAIEKYMPEMGEGKTMASQVCTAVNKLIYKWYNDGDVYDNTGYLDGWCNDLSSYANWIYNNFPTTQTMMLEVIDCDNDDYADLLYRLGQTLIKEDILMYLNTKPKTGSIYKCDGPFRFVEYDEEYDEEDEDA